MKYYEIEEDKESYGTRVYQSHSGHYDEAQLKNLASAILYFESAFLAILPAHRRDSRYARCISRHNENFRDPDRAQRIARVRATTSEAELFALWRGQGVKLFSWTFFRPRGGMIEYRQPPASLCAEDALGWAELALNFVQVAMRSGEPGGSPAQGITVASLRDYLAQHGFQQSQTNAPAMLAPIWNRVANRPQKIELEECGPQSSPSVNSYWKASGSGNKSGSGSSGQDSSNDLSTAKGRR